MQDRDTASAARSCLAILIIGAFLMLVVCVIVALGILPVGPGAEGSGEPLPATSAATDEVLTVAVLDVGQGASVVVITPEGDALIADAGRSLERIDEIVLPWLAGHGVEDVDYLVVTNPDQDHVGGMPALLEQLPVETWVDPVVPNTNQTYERSLELVEERGVDVLRARRGGTLDLGSDVTAQILWPVDPLMLDGSEPSHNDNSVVIKIAYGDVSFLIPGDIEQEAELALVNADEAEVLDADILVVPHHGSKTSSTGAFLDAVTPEVAIIPVGFDNQYGHPHDEVVQRLRLRDVRVYRTDLDGTVEVTTDGQSWDIETAEP